MLNIEDYSGNIKLRLPKSLHAELVNQAEQEGVSLNHLCSMHLVTGLSKRALGKEEFYKRLECIEIESQSNEAVLFAKLSELNEEINDIKPFLTKELKNIFEKNSRSFSEQMEVLSYIYPIYYNNLSDSKFPLLKIPSAKVVLRPNNKYLNFKEIESLVNPLNLDTFVAYGDFDYYIPLDMRDTGKERYSSVVINIRCEFESLFNSVRSIKDALKNSEQKDKFKAIVRPCFLHIDTRYLLKKAYPNMEFYF